MIYLRFFLLLVCLGLSYPMIMFDIPQLVVVILAILFLGIIPSKYDPAILLKERTHKS